MMDYKSIGDSYITIMQKRRGQKQPVSDKFVWGLIVLSISYIAIHLINWG